MDIPAGLGAALAQELDLPSVGEAGVILLRLVTALVLGALLGWDRERKGRAAGLRTHMLVCAGTALFVMAPLFAGVSLADATSVMEGIVAGIGFLGAGAILKSEGGQRVEGLTTAAGIFMTAAIGMAAGLGEELLAVAASMLALGVFAALPKLLGDEPATTTGADADAPRSGSADGSDEASR